MEYSEITVVIQNRVRDRYVAQEGQNKESLLQAYEDGVLFEYINYVDQEYDNGDGVLVEIQEDSETVYENKAMVVPMKELRELLIAVKEHLENLMDSGEYYSPGGLPYRDVERLDNAYTEIRQRYNGLLKD